MVMTNEALLKQLPFTINNQGKLHYSISVRLSNFLALPFIKEVCRNVLITLYSIDGG